MRRRAIAAIVLVIVVGLPAVHATAGLPGLQPTPDEPTPDSEPSLLIDGDELTIPASENATVRGETNIEAGTTLEVRLQSTDASQPFIRQQTATVDDAGWFDATFDLSAVTSRTAVRVTIHDPTGDELLNRTGYVVAPEGGFNAVDAKPPENDSTNTQPDDPSATIETSSDGSELRLAPATAQVIRGETNLQAGTELTVRMRSSGSSPFLESRGVTVESDGTFEAAFDLAAVPSGAPFQVEVRYDGTRLAETAGTIRASNPDIALVYGGESIKLDSAPGQTIRGETDLPRGSDVLVRIRSSNSSQPFIMQRETSVRENGTFDATFDLSKIDPGASFDVTVRHIDETIASGSGNVTAASGTETTTST